MGLPPGVSVGVGGDFNGSANNLVGSPQQPAHQQLPPQHSPRLESINGESVASASSNHHLPRYLDELSPYSCQYSSHDTYASVKYNPARGCVAPVPGDTSPWDQHSNPRSPRPPLEKPSYRCEENLQRYPQRCREEYYHRCSESNLMTERGYESSSSSSHQVQQQQHKYWSDVHKYLQRYSEEPLTKTVDDAELRKLGYLTHGLSQTTTTTTTTTDLQKFPQCYSEDPLRVAVAAPHSQQSLKYAPGLRCPEHHGGSFKYPSASKSAGFLANRILSPGGLPMIGHTAIGLVVNKFGSGPLDHHHLHRGGGSAEHQHFAHHAYEQSSFCPCESGTAGSVGRDEEEYLDGRYMMNNSMSDSDDM